MHSPTVASMLSVVWLVSLLQSVESEDTVVDLKCLESKTHKPEPTAESELFGEVAPYSFFLLLLLLLAITSSPK